ncbi:MAG: hypothetical protein QF440_05140 [Candidatus Thalassarchaeaceae archaeon]|jgi:hypothetical protein|nr:hypothetical protein [Candidatus Thalassarchaeaceae archaeon]
MTTDSYAGKLEDVLKNARDSPLPEKKEVRDQIDESDGKMRIAAVLAVLSVVDSENESHKVGRIQGTAWAQDHRRTRMGYSNLMRSRSRRATWR